MAQVSEWRREAQRRESPWKSPINVEAPALNGGDPWAGARGSDEDLKDTVDEAMSSTIFEPIIPQFYPSRAWLWQRWRGTILQRVLPNEVFWNSVFAALFVWVFGRIAATAEAASRKVVWRAATATVSPAPSVLDATGMLASVDKVWVLASGLVSFTLSFFLTQSYNFWRHIHDRARTVQGRLNDIGMLCASAAERHDAGPSKGQYTEEARAMLESLGRYVRLFHMLMFASLTSRFAVLRTPRGMGELVRRGAMTQPEYEALLQTSMGHHAVIEWISTLLNSALGDGRLCGSASGGSSGALQITLQAKLTELRAQYGGIEDQLTGRMPLAYTQLVQIMADILILATPLALIHSVGGVGAVVGTGLVTLFHSSILNLAKSFLDPLNNDAYSGNMGINVATLIQETNVASSRWYKSAAWVPEETLPVRRMSVPLPTQRAAQQRLGSAGSGSAAGAEAAGGSADEAGAGAAGAGLSSRGASVLDARAVQGGEVSQVVQQLEKEVAAVRGDEQGGTAGAAATADAAGGVAGDGRYDDEQRTEELQPAVAARKAGE